jgi:hypothetical protein
MIPSEFTLALVRHLATPAPVVRSLEAHAQRAADGGLEIAYCLRGDMARLLIPEPQPSGCADGLWEHTCFEVFVGVAGESGYQEFNFSPSGKWAAYAFGNYRQRDATRSLPVPPQIKARLSAGRLELEARIASTVLPRNAGAATLQIGLCAVIEAIDVVDGSHSYWALRHPAALPDFHHRDGFTLELAPPHGSA